MARPRATKDGGVGRKSEVITIRLDPRLKYLAELAARRQRRPLSSFVEWAIEDTLSRVKPGYDNSPFDQETTFADAASSLWDVDEADRFTNLALRFPELLTHHEQKVWKLIRECGALWRGDWGQHDNKWTWKIAAPNLVRERLREHWQAFQKVAAGEEPPSILPTWSATKPVPPPPPRGPAGSGLRQAFADKAAGSDDDEIPF